MIEKEKVELTESLNKLERKIFYNYPENYNHKIVVKYKKIKSKIEIGANPYNKKEEKIKYNDVTSDICYHLN